MRKKLLFLAILLVFSFVTLIPNDAFAGRDTKRDKHDYNLLKQKDDSEWYFEIAPYLWVAGIDGNISFSTNSATFSVDADLNNLVNNKDMEGTFGFNASIKKGRWGYYGDIFLAKLYNEGFDSTRTYQIKSKFDEGIITNALTVYLFNTKSLFTELMMGGRIWALKHDIDVYTVATGARYNTSNGKELWLDPFIGIRSQWDFSKRLYLDTVANYGGFNVGCDETYEVLVTFGIRFTKKHSLKLGYKVIKTEYEEDGFIFNVEHKGPYLAYYWFF